MEAADEARSLSEELKKLREKKSAIDDRISDLEAHLSNLNLHSDAVNDDGSCSSIPATSAKICHGLSPSMICRYSRHLILPSFGIEGQSKLSNSSILVVGAGGLGSPALLYLAACGVGRLGIVDHDIVELNNMHRQIVHAESFIGHPKVKSAAVACHSINSTVQIVEHVEALRTSNAVELMSQYDIIVDATDNAPSRYIISDCCVILGKPLVSGAALGFEGQLTVYNYNGGPCYRCLFPIPPPATACQRCSDSGVLGVVPGIIGCLQALEAIKIASRVGEPLSQRMLIFDALSSQIRIVKIRGRVSNCEVCRENSTFNVKQFRDFDYEKFTQYKPWVPLKLLEPEWRISGRELNEKVMGRGEAHLVIDVRSADQYKIASLSGSMNVPLSMLMLEAKLPEASLMIREASKERAGGSDAGASLYAICRRGNDSQRAVLLLQKMGFPSAKDIIGGLEAWSKFVDPNFPFF